MVLAWSAALLMLIDTVVAVLIVDFACFFVAEDVIGFCYRYEFLTC